MLATAEELASCYQYAYPRRKGAELHLRVLLDAAKDSPAKGRFVMMASVERDGAFDGVPHTKFLSVLLRYSLDCSPVRYVRAWLMRLKSRLRPLSQEGQCVTEWAAKSRGLPQGGTLSSLF